MTVSTTSFYSYNNTLCLKLDTAKMLVATQWLRAKGCRISTYSDRKTGRTQIKLLSAPNEVVAALRKKFGFFPAFAEVKQSAPVPAPKSTKSKQRSWATRAEYEAAMNPAPAVQVKPRNKIRNTDKLPLNSPQLAPIPVVKPNLATEQGLLNHRSISTGISRYNCLTVTKDFIDERGEHFAALPNPNYRAPNYPGTSDIGPALATKEQLLALTCEQLYKLAQTHKIMGRSAMKGKRHKTQLATKLTGYVKVTELK